MLQIYVLTMAKHLETLSLQQRLNGQNYLCPDLTDGSDD